ncbi:MAG: hypothetical protein ACP5MW_07025, partial [Thermoplasmata archaeon]
STMIDYSRIKEGKKEALTDFFRFEKRIVWYYEYRIDKESNRRIIVFIDEKLKAEEEKDILGRIDEMRIKDTDEAKEELDKFYKNQYRIGTIGVITNIEDSAVKVYEMLKSRVNIEQLYDTFKNTLHGDRTYMRGDYEIEGWMMINFVSMVIYYRIYNILVEKDLLKEYSPSELLVCLS